jgi:hypothetical protein
MKPPPCFSRFLRNVRKEVKTMKGSTSMEVKSKGKSKSVERHQASHRRIQVWWLPEEYEQMQQNARYCGLTASEYIRRSALDQKIAPRTDKETIGQLMKLGGLQLKLIADLRETATGSNADESKLKELIAEGNQLYKNIHAAIRNITKRPE